MPASKPRESFVADSLAGGMLLMLGLTVIQRGVGFLRGIWFCRLLDDMTLGQWAMAYGFITLITPLMMLGLPGAMPRFVERYRRAGQLRGFLRRVLLGTSVGATVVLGSMLLAPDFWAWLVFRRQSAGPLMGALAAAVAAVLVFNFVVELVASLRQVRVNSVMQFLQGVGFTVLGIAGLYLGWGLIGLLIAFGVATALAALPGFWVLASGWSGLPTTAEPLDSRSMWRSLLPYAVALWTINLLTNLFEVADRYMILHFTAGGEAAAQAVVGQYHSGLLIPTLLVSLAMMYAGVLMPYLAADWEAGRRAAASARLRQTLTFASLIFTAAAAVILLIAPWLFETLLQGRYGDGLRVLPQTFVICIWVALVTLAQLYVWLNEQGKWVGAALLVGISLNLLLNRLWLPQYGLEGAVAATLVAGGVVLTGLWWVMSRFGFEVDPGCIWASILPLTLLSGPWIPLVAVSLIAVAVPRVRQELVRAVRGGVAVEVAGCPQHAEA